MKFRRKEHSISELSLHIKPKIVTTIVCTPSLVAKSSLRGVSLFRANIYGKAVDVQLKKKYISQEENTYTHTCQTFRNRFYYMLVLTTSHIILDAGNLYQSVISKYEGKKTAHGSVVDRQKKTCFECPRGGFYTTRTNALRRTSCDVHNRRIRTVMVRVTRRLSFHRRHFRWVIIYRCPVKPRGP